MPSDAPAISAKGVTKSYRLFSHPGDRVKQFLTAGLKQYHRRFTAIDDVSFEIGRGQTVGIIGPNGSGKSTLLQLICGILKPDAGSISVSGRISALLELGSGFNPEFTGRENVYFQGALMGFTRAQMDERFDDIAAFADIGEFIDQPVRMYSSGMFVRLAFAVGIHVSPDFLVVDEALAVGDEAFQRQCFLRIDAIREAGGNVLFVSHNMNMIATFCDSVMLLERGRLVMHGETGPTVSMHRRLLLANDGGATSTNEDQSYTSTVDGTTSGHGGRARDGEKPPMVEDGAELLKIGFATADGEATGSLLHGRTYRFVYEICVRADVDRVNAVAYVKLKNGFILGTLSAPGQNGAVFEGDVAAFSLTFNCMLLPGTYMLDCEIAGEYQGTRKILHTVTDLPVLVQASIAVPAIGAINFSVGSMEMPI
jgi:ABC-type polysaccharide/polyol phosphate transport system ATPase subunit